MTPHPVTVYRHRTWHPTPSQYTDTGHDIPSHHSIQTQDMTPHHVTVYRHRTWHPIPSQYTDTGHDTPPRHSIQTQDMTPHHVTVYRHRTWHPIPSQYTDTAPTCRCAIHWCGTSHWNTQLPILMDQSASNGILLKIGKRSDLLSPTRNCTMTIENWRKKRILNQLFSLMFDKSCRRWKIGHVNWASNSGIPKSFRASTHSQNFYR